jgi:hypothetical protein
MTAQSLHPRTTPRDVVRLFDAAKSRADFLRASAALSAIPSAMLTNDDRGELVRAMTAAVARTMRFPVSGR